MVGFKDYLSQFVGTIWHISIDTRTFLNWMAFCYTPVTYLWQSKQILQGCCSRIEFEKITLLFSVNWPSSAYHYTWTLIVLILSELGCSQCRPVWVHLHDMILEDFLFCRTLGSLPWRRMCRPWRIGWWRTRRVGRRGAWRRSLDTRTAWQGKRSSSDQRSVAGVKGHKYRGEGYVYNLAICNT